MKTRIILGSILIAILGGIFYFDHARGTDVGFCFLAVAMMTVGVYEYYKMADLPRGLIFTGLATTALLQLSVWLEIHDYTPLPLTEILLFASLFAFNMISFFTDPNREKISNLALAFTGLFYVGFLGSFFIQMRAIPDWGEVLLLYTVVTSKSTDIFAYFTGSFLGKHKWIPRISPGKTWEGLAGGMMGAGLVGVACWWWLGNGQIFTWYYVLIFSIILGFCAQLGDLAESLVKRSFAAKDSSQLLPEFGGVMDLIDSLLFTGPIVYFAWQITVLYF